MWYKRGQIFSNAILFISFNDKGLIWPLKSKMSWRSLREHKHVGSAEQREEQLDWGEKAAGKSAEPQAVPCTVQPSLGI